MRHLAIKILREAKREVRVLIGLMSNIILISTLTIAQHEKLFIKEYQASSPLFISMCKAYKHQIIKSIIIKDWVMSLQHSHIKNTHHSIIALNKVINLLKRRYRSIILIMRMPYPLYRCHLTVISALTLILRIFLIVKKEELDQLDNQHKRTRHPYTHLWLA